MARAIKLPPEDPAARDEGPRLLPLGHVEPVHPTLAHYIALADKALSNDKRDRRRMATAAGEAGDFAGGELDDFAAGEAQRPRPDAEASAPEVQPAAPQRAAARAPEQAIPQPAPQPRSTPPKLQVPKPPASPRFPKPPKANFPKLPRRNW